MAYHRTFKMMICLLIYIYLKEIARTPKTKKKKNPLKCLHYVQKLEQFCRDERKGRVKSVFFFLDSIKAKEDCYLFSYQESFQM